MSFSRKITSSACAEAARSAYKSPIFKILERDWLMKLYGTHFAWMSLWQIYCLKIMKHNNDSDSDFRFVYYGSVLIDARLFSRHVIGTTEQWNGGSAHKQHTHTHSTQMHIHISIILRTPCFHSRSPPSMCDRSDLKRDMRTVSCMAVGRPLNSLAPP